MKTQKTIRYHLFLPQMAKKKKEISHLGEIGKTAFANTNGEDANGHNLSGG